MEDNYWSIIPIDECASVDNGLVTFKECAIGKTYIVTYKNGMCESKTTINVTGESACKCTDLVVSGDKTIESDANTDIEIGTYTAGCVTDITASTSADWVTSITANTGSIKASVKGNTSTTKPNTATITVTGKAGTEICTKTFTLTQKAKESDPCDRFEVTGVEALPFYDATYTIANFTIDVATNIGVVNSTLPEWVLSSSVVVDNDNGKITAFIERNRDGKEKEREKEITVTGKVGTVTCTKKFTLKQKKEYNRSCYRGTDNGADRYEDGSTRMRPTLLCGENGSYRQDSIYIENGDSGNLQYKLNGGSWMTFGGSGFDPAAWVHVGFDTIVGCCSNKFMKIVAQSQCNVSDCIPGEYYRSVKFSFRKKNYQEGDLVPQCAKTGTCDGPANEKLCDEWEYEIKQCAVGYYWAADSESMHSYNAYPAKCGSGKLVYWGCDCSTPVVCDCSALKVNDVESVPSSGYEAETKLAKYTSDTSCGTVSKPTFVDGSGVDFVVWSTPTTTKLKGTVSKNETSSEKKATYKLTQGACNTEFEIKQEAGSDCTCSSSNFSVTGVNVDASGGNAVLIANFTSECEPSLSFENYAGETFIDYSITSSTYDSSTKKGKIYAKVPQNTTSSSRTEQVGVYINNETDFCKHFTVTQSEATPAECYVNVKDEINVNEVNVTYKVLNSSNEEVGSLPATSLSTTERRINLQGNTEGVLKVITEYSPKSMYKQISQSTSTGSCSSTIICKCSRTVNILGKLVESTSGDSKCYKLGTFIADHTLFNNLEIIYAPYFWNGSAWKNGDDVTAYFNKEETEVSENIEYCYGNCTWTHCYSCNNVPQGCFASYGKCIIQGGTVIGKKCEYTDTVTATKYILTYEEPF